MEDQVEIWKALPGVPGVEVSTLGRVRTLDRVTSSEKYTRFTKGHVLKQYSDKGGYLQAHIPIDGKQTKKYVHRLAAQTFIKNPDNLPQVNHRDCDRTNNNVENLEFCTPKYNNQYREKFGEAQGHPVFAINLDTLEVSCFPSQNEASRVLGINVASINMVIKGSRNQAGGYYFKKDDGNGVEIDKDKLNDIVDGMRFTGGIFAVNLKTLEVSRFNSQSEASRLLGVDNSTITKVTKGKYNQAGGYWFVNDDDNAADAIKQKLHDIEKTGLKIKQGR